VSFIGALQGGNTQGESGQDRAILRVGLDVWQFLSVRRGQMGERLRTGTVRRRNVPGMIGNYVLCG